MTAMFGLILGGVLSFGLVRLARAYPPGSERFIYAVGLIVTALIYSIFGMFGGASSRWLALEGLGVVVYGAAAWAGLRGRHALLAAGWAAHVVWDVALHLNGAGAEYTPGWYPWSCVSFDLVVAGAVLASRRRTAAESEGRHS